MRRIKQRGVIISWKDVAHNLEVLSFNPVSNDCWTTLGFSSLEGAALITERLDSKTEAGRMLAQVHETDRWAFFAFPLVAGAAILRGSLDPGPVEHVKASQCDERDSHDVAQCVLECAEQFWWQQQHRLQVGVAKAALLDTELRHQISTRQQAHASSSFVVVEFGTSDGYSTTRLVRLMPEGYTLYVVEHEARRQAVAQEFLAFSAKYLKPKIEFMHTRPSHAIDMLRCQGISADFVF